MKYTGERQVETVSKRGRMYRATFTQNRSHEVQLSPRQTLRWEPHQSIEMSEDLTMHPEIRRQVANGYLVLTEVK